jgi:hypothetical protein
VLLLSECLLLLLLISLSIQSENFWIQPRMSACMYICMYICMHVFVYVCMHVRTYARLYYECVYIYTHTYVCVYACVCMCMYVCICVCVFRSVLLINCYLYYSVFTSSCKTIFHGSVSQYFNICSQKIFEFCQFRESVMLRLKFFDRRQRIVVFQIYCSL